MRRRTTYWVITAAFAAFSATLAYAQPAPVAAPPADCLSGAVYAVPSHGAATEHPATALPTQVGPDVRALYVGERHGIDAHPKAAACLLSHLGGRVHTLVLEQIRQDQQAIVDTQRATHPETASQLGSALTWWKSGWPAWRLYEQLVSMAWIGRIAVRGGDVAFDAKRPAEGELARSYADSAGPNRFEPAVQSWATAMRRAHCNLIDDTRARDLALTQVHRDLAMASVVHASVRTQGVVMFYGGRAHARRDRSLPSLAVAKAPSDHVSIALMEDADPQTRRATAEGLRGQYDLVWFVGQPPKTPESCERLASLTGRPQTKR